MEEELACGSRERNQLRSCAGPADTSERHRSGRKTRGPTRSQPHTARFPCDIKEIDIIEEVLALGHGSQAEIAVGCTSTLQDEQRGNWRLTLQ